GFRTGTSHRFGLPTGTVSIGPRQNRALLAVFPRLGGMMPARPAASASRTRPVTTDDRLYYPSHSIDDPDPDRDHVGLVSGGAIRTRRSDRTHHRPAQRRRHRRRLAHFRLLTR